MPLRPLQPHATTEPEPQQPPTTPPAPDPSSSTEPEAPSKEPELEVAVVFRLWSGDLFGMALPQLDAWVQYMTERAGATRVHLYEHCQNETECVAASRGAKRWCPPAPPDIDDVHFFAQTTAYADALAHAQPASWMLQLDLDEYPFMPSDTHPGFLRRYAAALPHTTTQVLLPCLFFGGPADRPDDPRLSVRYQHRAPAPEVQRDKPLFLAAAAGPMVYREFHRVRMLRGETVRADWEVLRLHHFWGPDRLGADQAPVYDPAMALFTIKNQ